ncbi:DUF1853 family protein [Marinobacter mobilis]|uniref:DUF1853 domain-containing protein n=1 Tax=Marinobacter mobilis TaxID=488533 RepID=A0A1H2ZQL2_9GAMM|nr:DUF1853 family protein [Marinobacter mobilis]SDX19677.1 hypothetical protein SAMN04487960_10728 [Marinobacter mobilis]
MMTPDNNAWNTPAVRHLAWLCGAPSLICNELTRSLPDHLPENTFRRLRALDLQPEPLLDALSRSQSYRLGHYFEELYHFLLTWLLEWPVLARNAAIRSDQGSTLGELDFVVQNPVTNQFEHHEIAVKFYLGVPEHQGTRWFGPNPNDRLDLKTDRMLSHQLTMSQRPETRRVLAACGVSETIHPVLFMPGYLFHPIAPALPEPPLADWINPRHERGGWLYHSQLDLFDTRHWTPLQKPHWLGNFRQAMATPGELTEQSLSQVALSGRPALFAKMGKCPQGNGLREVERWFVVPDHWPGRA